MTVFLTDVINRPLKEEQDQLLNRSRYQRAEDGRHRNGFKRIRLKGLWRTLVVNKPVLRRATPPSPLVRLLRRAGSGFVGLLASRFWLRGASTRAVAQELNAALGTRLSASDVSRFTDTLLPDIRAWLQRPIPEGIAYVFLDALYLPVRRSGFTAQAALLAAVGLTPEGQRHVLGFLLGDRENQDAWSALLKDLLDRGLNRSAVALVLSDDHKAIRAAVQSVLGLPHQLCVVHKMRNALARVPARHRGAFYADFKADYLNNLLFTLKNQTLRDRFTGIEPGPQKDGLTPENLKKALEEFLTICARRTGMERILAIRRRIAGISYSKETVGVNFIFARPPDGNSKSEGSRTSAAPSAAPPFCPPARKQKRPGRDERPDPFLEFVSNEMVGTLCPLQKTVMFSFPNIAHNYWDHYRLTGEFYVRPAKAPRL